MKRSKTEDTLIEGKCPSCAGTGFPKVEQPVEPIRKIFPAPCKECAGKGRLAIGRPPKPAMPAPEWSWYVSFRTKGRKGYRTTKTFQSENEAKAFALEILSQGFVASSGTLNPHRPKQTIGPFDIAAWTRLT